LCDIYCLKINLIGAYSLDKLDNLGSLLHLYQLRRKNKNFAIFFSTVYYPLGNKARTIGPEMIWNNGFEYLPMRHIFFKTI